MKKRFVISLIILMLTHGFVYPKVSKSGTTAAGFLNVDVGARAIGMGGAFVAIANDATTMYWNPAGIASMNQMGSGFCHTRWIADISFDYAALIVPLNQRGVIGVHAKFMTMGDMERTTLIEPEGTGETFGAGSYAIGVCYARSLTDRFSIGFNAKYIHEKIYHCAAQGFAIDIGTLFETQFNGLKIGMNISNYGTKLRMNGRDLLVQTDIDPSITGNNDKINASLKTDAFDMPLMFRVGIAMDVLQNSEKNQLTLAIDALHPNNNKESLNVGSEYVFNNLLALRAGYQSLFLESSQGGLCLGAGIQYQWSQLAGIHIDFAYHDFGILNDVQTFSIGLDF